jgi:hypothetical protein
MFQTKVVEKTIAHIFRSVTFFGNGAVYEIMWKNTVQATDDSMTHAHCMLDTNGYKHTLRTCNNNCSSTTSMVARTRLGVTF